MIRLQAPAKLNLFLRVLGRRPDGYHEIETLFERIDLADELTFTPAARLEVTVSDPSLDSGPSNLVTKAAVSNGLLHTFTMFAPFPQTPIQRRRLHP